MESNTGPLYGKTPTVPMTWSLIADTFVAPSQLADMLEAQPAWRMSFAIMACWTCLAMIAIGMREAVIPTIVSITIMLPAYRVRRRMKTQPKPINLQSHGMLVRGTRLDQIDSSSE